MADGPDEGAFRMVTGGPPLAAEGAYPRGREWRWQSPYWSSQRPGPMQTPHVSRRIGCRKVSGSARSVLIIVGNEKPQAPFDDIPVARCTYRRVWRRNLGS